MIDLTIVNIIKNIENITGKRLSENDYICGPNSSLESIEFVQIIAFIEDEYISNANVDLLYEFSLEYKEMDINGLCDFIKKWI